MEKVTSKDGTMIAYEKEGKGPVVVLVDAALADRNGQAKMASLLASKFTVVRYDRRGRGDSSDTLPYAPQREIEDLTAVVDALGDGPVCFYGGSSGAALALDASNALGKKVKKQVLFEPPFVIDDSFQPVSRDLAGKIAEAAKAGKRDKAAQLFFREAMRIPAFGVFMMRFMPMWPGLAKIAHTAAYDITLLYGTQDGKPLPADRWTNVSADTLILTGEKSEAFFHVSARALADQLAHGEHRILTGVDHGTPFMKPEVVVDLIAEFLAA